MPVGPLPVAMIELALQTLLVAAVGLAVLPATGLAAAIQAAIAVSSITVRADEKQCVALVPEAHSRTQNQFASNRHLSSQRGFDNGNGSWQLRTSFDAW
jgi:hypothetical protein